MVALRLSASSITTWQTCETLWDVTYNAGLESALDDSSFEINYGRGFHGLLEGLDGPLTEHFGALWQEVIRTHHGAYVAHWGSESQKHLGYTVVEHEVPFEFELYPGIILHGYLDAIVELNGKFYIAETKTTGAKIEPNESYWEYKLRDNQVNTYLLAAQHCEALKKYDIQGVIYDVTRRPGIRQKKRSGETAEAYAERVDTWYYENRDAAFQRLHMTKTSEELLDFSADIQTFAEAIARKSFTKNRASCYKFKKRCGIDPYCFGGASLSDQELFQIRKRR